MEKIKIFVLNETDGKSFSFSVTRVPRVGENISLKDGENTKKVVVTEVNHVYINSEPFVEIIVK